MKTFAASASSKRRRCLCPYKSPNEAAWQDTISTSMLKTTQFCKAGLHQIREEHLKHFYLCTLNWNFYFYLFLYLGQAQKNQAYSPAMYCISVITVLVMTNFSFAKLLLQVVCQKC